MRHQDPAWLDVQYNNRARVPQHLQIFERWRKASATAREGSSCELDLRYGDLPGETLDVFPAARAGSPVFVFIHGGYWRSLDKSDVTFVAPSFVSLGATVVVPDYALCPAVTIDTIALQLVSALEWVWRHAARYHGDPARIVVCGHSAGGHLAAMLLCCDWPSVAPDLPAQLVSSALSISGLFDLEPLRQTPFLKDDLQLTPASVRRLSPALFPPPKGTLFAAVGGAESEEFLRQNELIREAWGAAAVPVCETIPGANHFDILHQLVDPATRLHALAGELLGLSPSKPEIPIVDAQPIDAENAPH
jgi:arylformamidase